MTTGTAWIVAAALVTAGNAVAQQEPSKPPVYGVASPYGCVTFAGAPIAPGTKVTVIVPDSTTRYSAVVGERMQKCGADDDGTAYALSQPKMHDIAGNAVAVIGSAPSHYRAHECASHEGVHLFLFAGKKRHLQALWHTYVYFGYDIEPSCTAQDIARIETVEAQQKRTETVIVR